MEFRSGNRTEIIVHCLFGGYGGGIGTAWYDDVYLHEIHDTDLGGAIQAVAMQFQKTASAAEKKTLQAFLRKRWETEQDAFSKSLFDTLHGQPNTEPVMERKFKPDARVHERGAQIYQRTCIACHGPDGKGVPGAFPPLDGSDWLTGDAEVSIKILLHGLWGPIEVRGAKFLNVMPPHITLSDQDISDVLTYARQSWSNDARPVRMAQAAATRRATKDRTTSWTAEELR